MIKGLGRRLSRKSESERSSTSLSPYQNKSNNTSLTDASLNTNRSLSERSIGRTHLEEIRNLQKKELQEVLSEQQVELQEAPVERKQSMNAMSRATTPTSESESASAFSNMNVHSLHEKIFGLERERSEMKSIVMEVILQLQELSDTKEEFKEEVDLPELQSDNVFAIYERLRTAVGLIHPLKEYVQRTHAEKRDLKADVAMLENEHQVNMSLMAQERRRAADALHFKENAVTRLQEQVEALESEIKEAQQLAQAHDTLKRSATTVYRDIHVSKSSTSSIASLSMDGSRMDDSTVSNVREKVRKQRDIHVSKSSASSIASLSMDGSRMDDSAVSNVREKVRKQRESASRFLSRFQATSSSGQRRNSKSPILGLTVNKPVADLDYGDTCSVLSSTPSMSPSIGSQGGESKDCCSESKMDDEGMSYVIPNFAQFPSSATTARPCSPAAAAAARTSILKRDPLETIPVDTRRKSWKKLPVPGLDKMGSSSRSMTSFCTDTSSSAPYDDDISLSSSQSYSISLAGGSVPRTPTRIRFESVQIRRYHQTLGDNPAVTYGPPIALDWKYEEMSPVQVDEYEGTRGSDRIPDSNKLVLSSMDRRRVLKNKGFTEEEIDHASQEAEKTRKERAMTNALLPAMKVEEVLQSTRRKVKRLLKKSKNQKDKDISSSTLKTSHLTDASPISTLPSTTLSLSTTIQRNELC
jgi:hypothetical protein